MYVCDLLNYKTFVENSLKKKQETVTLAEVIFSSATLTISI